jgi:hypothetical protein
MIGLKRHRLGRRNVITGLELPERLQAGLCPGRDIDYADLCPGVSFVK